MFKKIKIPRSGLLAMPPTTFVVESVPTSSSTLTSLRRFDLADVPVKDLPDPSVFSIDAYRRSGLPLDKVNTKVLGTRPSEDVINSIINALDEAEKSEISE